MRSQVDYSSSHSMFLLLSKLKHYVRILEVIDQCISFFPIFQAADVNSHWNCARSIRESKKCTLADSYHLFAFVVISFFNSFDIFVKTSIKTKFYLRLSDKEFMRRKIKTKKNRTSEQKRFN